MSKKVTIDELARITAEGFAELHNQMATKEGLRAVRDRVLTAIDGLELKLSAYVGSWNRDFAQLHDRVKVLEQKRGHH